MFEFNCVKKRPIACFFASFEGEKQEAGYYSLPLACVGFSALCRGRVIWWGGRAYLEMGSSIDLIYIFYRKNGLSHNPTPNPACRQRSKTPSVSCILSEALQFPPYRMHWVCGDGNFLSCIRISVIGIFPTMEPGLVC